MKTNDHLIYSKRYPTLDEEYMHNHMFEDAESVESILKHSLMDSSDVDVYGSVSEYRSRSTKIEYVPDIIRLERSEGFISKIKHFSET